MFKDERDYFPWIAGALIFGSLILFNVIKAREVEVQAKAPPAIAELPEPGPLPANEPAPLVADGEAFNAYVCDTGGVRQYSDRPCAAGAIATRIPITLSTVSAPPLPAPVITNPSGRTSSPSLHERPSSGGSPACDRLFAAKDQIDERMRAGYGNASGEQLRRRHHQITDQIRDLRCYR